MFSESAFEELKLSYSTEYNVSLESKTQLLNSIKKV